jgi:hypothetical protein
MVEKSTEASDSRFTTPKTPALEGAKPVKAPATTKPSQDAKFVRVSVNGKQDHAVHGINFKAAPTVYEPGSLGWNDEQWEAARKDAHLVIEEVDANGNLLPEPKA